MTNEENNEVYHNLTESVEAKNPAGKDKWTIFLVLCCLTAAFASFTFGYNIGSTNLPTPLIKDFFARKYFNEFSVKNDEFCAKDKQYKDTKAVFDSAESKFNSTSEALRQAKENGNSTEELQKILDKLEEESMDKNKVSLKEYLDQTRSKLEEASKDLEEKRPKLLEGRQKIDEFNTFLWTITTALFVVGGMIGAFTSKYVADYLGRKKGIIFHYIFVLVGGVLVLIAPYINSPECVVVSRFLFGVQGGMSCGLIPTYLSEISPAGLRGATGVIHQLGITCGILVAQTLGFRQLLGTAPLWHFLLALPLVPCFLGAVLLLLFFPESPRALLINNRDEESARKALISLRHTTNVAHEIDQINQESRETKSDEAISLKELFTSSELRWPLITGLILQMAQQLCGINAVFFYSESIFRRSSIQDEHIQYAVFLTGAINVVCTIVVVPLIDKLGRKPLLVYPMIVIILDFLLLTACLILQHNGIIYSYLSIVCIIVFIMCFAVGLGPIPFIYVAECFRQDARSAALAICMFTNWVANLVLTLTFPYLAKLLSSYVFLVFTVIVAFAVIIIIKKVPETKNRSVDEIMAYFDGKKKPANNDESTGKLMSANTKV
jgi:MFS transporter, SP family, solute carrier family 2 (facilitated glucose transporter), member 1